MEEQHKGFYDLTNLLKNFKRPVTYKEVVEVVCKEGWFSDFKRLGFNTVIRQINRHNEKYKGKQYPYNNQ